MAESSQEKKKFCIAIEINIDLGFFNYLVSIVFQRFSLVLVFGLVNKTETRYKYAKANICKIVFTTNQNYKKN